MASILRRSETYLPKANTPASMAAAQTGKESTGIRVKSLELAYL